jgi:protein gp37
MSDNSAIQWTDATWNPTTGCTKISPGCAHCYIERTPAFRIHGRRFTNGHIPLLLHPDRLEQPLHWKKPRRIFVNSLSDLFHEDVPDQFLHEVYHVMEQAHWHVFQVLTKRAERMRNYLTWRYGPDEEHSHGRIPSRHIWHGVSVENQHWKSRVIPHLVNTPSAVRFVSLEPLLEDLGDIWDWFPREREVSQTRSMWIDGVNWVIVGGESGPQSRDCAIDWVRSIRWQCREAHVPCFVKQLGRQPRVSDGVYLNLKDKKGGVLDEWPIDLRVREFP